MSKIFALGFVLFLTGWAHRHPKAARLDEALFLQIHRACAKCAPIFKILWVFGTLPAAFAAASVIAWLGGIKYGAYSLLAYLIAVAIERAIKETIRRPRPYQSLASAEMKQPREPSDTSFPSGDALRAWLFALALAAFVPTWAAWLLFGIAFAVSIGRMVLGVHHPLDVLTGTGMGLMAGALLRMLW